MPDNCQAELRIDVFCADPAQLWFSLVDYVLLVGVDVSHLRSSSSVWVTRHAGNGTNAGVANNDDLIRGLCLFRVRRSKHRESVRGEEQQPKHECYYGWTE